MRFSQEKPASGHLDLRRVGLVSAAVQLKQIARDRATIARTPAPGNGRSRPAAISPGRASALSGVYLFITSGTQTALGDLNFGKFLVLGKLVNGVEPPAICRIEHMLDPAHGICKVLVHRRH